MRCPRILFWLLITLTGVAWAGAASADAFSPAVYASGTRSLHCSIVNLGKEQLAVTIQVIAADDAGVLATHDSTLGPGEGTTWGYYGESSLQYCAFRGRFSAKAVRATALIQDLSGNTLLTLPAL